MNYSNEYLKFDFLGSEKIFKMRGFFDPLMPGAIIENCCNGSGTQGILNLFSYFVTDSQQNLHVLTVLHLVGNVGIEK